jgi:hypothetical protein
MPSTVPLEEAAGRGPGSGFGDPEVSAGRRTGNEWRHAGHFMVTPPSGMRASSTSWLAPHFSHWIFIRTPRSANERRPERPASRGKVVRKPTHITLVQVEPDADPQNVLYKPGLAAILCAVARMEAAGRPEEWPSGLRRRS